MPIHGRIVPEVGLTLTRCCGKLLNECRCNKTKGLGSAVLNVFCKTGQGGGVDPSCSGGGRSGGSGLTPSQTLLNLAALSLSSTSREGGLGPHDKRKVAEEYKTAIANLPPKAAQAAAQNLTAVHFASTPARLRQVAESNSQPLSTPKEVDIGGLLGRDGKMYLLAAKYGKGVYEHELAHAVDTNNVHSHSKGWIAAWNKEISWHGDENGFSKLANMSPSEGFAEFARAAWTGQKGDLGNLTLGKSEISRAELRQKFPMMSEYFTQHGFFPSDKGLGSTVQNIFCKTGQGGGIDPTCGSGKSTLAGSGPVFRTENPPSPKVQAELDRVTSHFSTTGLSTAEMQMVHDWKTGNSTVLKDPALIAAVEKGVVTKDITVYRAGGTSKDKALEFSTRESWVRDTAEASDRPVVVIHLKKGDKALFVPFATEHHLVEVGVLLPPSTMELRHPTS